MGKQNDLGKSPAGNAKNDDGDSDRVRSLKNSNKALIAAYNSLLTRMKHFNQAIEQGPVAVIISDTNGDIEYVNSKFEALTGYKANEVIGRNPSLLKSGETPDTTYAGMWKMLKQGKEWTGIFHNQKKSGEMFWERAVISSVTDNNNQITHYVAVKEDITKEKLLEEKLQQERLKFFHHSKMAEVGLLAASILHEVNNPISAIRGLVSELKETIGNQPNDIVTDQASLVSYTYNHLITILEHTDRLTDITHEISDFTSPQTGGKSLLDLNSVIRSCCKLVRFDERCRNITLTSELDQQLPAIKGYKNQLSHLVLNLLINAADAAGDIAGRQANIVVNSTQIGDQILVTITDNGCGMSADIQASMFDAFYTTKETGKGSGLGLSLCQSIVESHHGHIEIESQVGTGTEVRILLPINNEIII